MALIGNYSVFNKSAGSFSNGLSIAQSRAASNTSGKLRNRFYSFDTKAAAEPTGYLHPYARLLPLRGGGLASSINHRADILNSIALAAGVNLQSTNSSTITTSAVIDLIVTLFANNTLTSSTNFTLRGSVEMQLLASALITTNGNIGAIIDALVAANVTINTNIHICALAHLGAVIGGPTPLSPEGLANAVWQRDITGFTNLGSAGYKLNDLTSSSGGGGGGPTTAQIAAAVWETPVPASFIAGTAGEKLGNLSNGISGSSSISVVPTAFTLTTGIETNSFLNTQEADGSVHQIDDIGNTIDCYYEFDIGINGVPTSASVLANLQSANDTLGVYAFRWADSTWRQVGTLPGTGSASYSNYSWSLLANQVGTGANLGKVRLRFAGGSSNPRLDIDSLLLNYTRIDTVFQFEGVLVSSTINTSVFPNTASNVDQYYKPSLLLITAGTGAGQSRRVDSYVGATRIATLATNWATIPDSTSQFKVLPWGSVRVTEIESAALTSITTELDTNSTKLDEIDTNTKLIPALV